MKPRSLALAMLATPLSVLWLAAQAPDRPPATITEYVLAVEPNLSPVMSLTTADFTVRSDGEPATVQSVAQTDEPLSLAILIDASRSMGLTFPFGDVTKAIDMGIIAGLRPGDRVRVGSILGQPRFSPGLIADPAALRRLVVEAASGGKDARRTGPSPIWDAVWQASVDLQAEPGHRAILLISDGRSTGNVHGYAETLRQVVFSGVTVYAIGESARSTLPQADHSAVVIQPFLTIQDLTNQSGGLYASDRSVASAPPDPTAGANAKANPKPLRLSMRDILERMMGAQRHGYAVTFASPGDGKFHKLAVTVRRPGVSVHARSAYLAR